MPIDNFAQQDSPVVQGSAEGAPLVADRSNNVGLIRNFNQACDVSQGALPRLSITGLPEDGMLPTANGPHSRVRTADAQPQVQPVRNDGRTTVGPPSPQTQGQDYRPIQGDRQNADFRPQSPFPQNTDGSFSPDQLSEIFRMRDRAMSLHRGEKPTIGTTDGTSKPNGPRIPTDTRNPNDRPPNDTKRPNDALPNEKVKFETSEIDQAIETARRLNKPLIVKLGFPGCGACQKMGRESWPYVKDQLAKDAVFVDVNVTESEEAAARFPARSYPTVIGYNVTTDGAGKSSLQEIGRDQFMDRNRLSSFLSDISQRYRGQR
jgi:Thioredoxin.